MVRVAHGKDLGAPSGEAGYNLEVGAMVAVDHSSVRLELGHSLRLASADLVALWVRSLLHPLVMACQIDLLAKSHSELAADNPEA